MTTLKKRRDRVQSARDMDFQTQAWCADLSTGLSGNVGTIEPGTERKNGINIQPGASGGAAWDGARDGQATPFLTMDVADAMRNFALMPAIQKWRPTYRYGIISDIDLQANTCTVTLGALTSSIQALNINHQSVFNSVPIDYMDCNAAAFENGDHVIVKFSPYNAVTGQPKVIGFVDHPKPCESLNFKLSSINGASFPVEIPHQYQLRVTQPIPQVINSGSSKGTYTEDFTVIGAGALDLQGVISITVDPGVQIDYDYPLHVSIKNAYKWTYWTTDWKGACPDRGVKFSTDGSAPWVTQPTSDLGSYDYLLDVVQWINLGIDIREEDQTVFQNAAGESLNGYEIDATGIKVLRRDHVTYSVNSFICDYYEWPQNSVEHQYHLSQYVPYDFDNSLWDNKTNYINLQDIYSCPDHIAGSCFQDGVGGEVSRNYISIPAPGNSSVYTYGSPGILSDRNGQNIAYDLSKKTLDVEGDYLCSYTWWGVSPSHDPPYPPFPCYYGYDAGECTGQVAEAGEDMIYEMIDLPEEYL